MKAAIKLGETKVEAQGKVERLSRRAEQLLCGGSGLMVTLFALAILPATIERNNPFIAGKHRHVFPLSPRVADAALLLAVFSLVGIVTYYRFCSFRRTSRSAQRATTQRISETDDVTDELLQGVQGLLLTFHVAAQSISEDHVSKKLMDHALSEADELISNGRKRFEQAAFKATPEDTADAADQDGGLLLDVLKKEYLEARPRESEERP